MSNNCVNSNSFTNAYNNAYDYNFDTLGYIGPRTQYDIDLQNKWNTEHKSGYCNSNISNSYNNISTSNPEYGNTMMRTDYDYNLNNTFAPNMNTCGIRSENFKNISYSMPNPEYQGFRTDYDLGMQQQWNRNNDPCVAENFSYGLSFNDQNNVYSYSGNMNCDSTCVPCNSYPIPVSSCGNNFDIIKIDNCNNNEDYSKPVNNCNGYF